MDEAQRRSYYLNALGIQVWAQRNKPDAVTDDSVAAPSVMPVTADFGITAEGTQQGVPLLDWGSLQQRVAHCTACGLHSTRTQTVFGVGDIHAQWMVIGEAPGADEDRQGEPFVGRAGKLLNEMLLAIGLRRADVYIANVLKCRPPNNRDPLPAEVEQCEFYLKRQVELVQPKIILAVGRIAAQNLLQTDITIGKLRGRQFSYEGIPLVVTYHPAYLLRSPAEKRKAWDDLCFARGVWSGTLAAN